MTAPSHILPTDHPDSFTALRTKGPLLAKLIWADDSVRDYDNAKRYAAAPIDAASLDQVEILLRWLAPLRRCSLTPGAIVAGADRRDMRRLLKPKDGDPATLADVPRSLLPLDMDAVACPPGFDITDLAAAAELVRASLPPVFHRAACLCLATGTYGVKPGLRFRLFFQLSRPLKMVESKAWLQAIGARIDYHPHHAAGLYYTARPIFEKRARDPLPGGRIVRLPGAERVEVPATIDLPKQGTVLRGLRDRARLMMIPRRTRTLACGSPLLAAAAILDAAEKGGRHDALIRAGFLLANGVLAGRSDAAAARDALAVAAQAAITDPGRDAVRESDSVFDWTLDRAQAELNSFLENVGENNDEEG